jgi:hypothetical protein
MQVRDVIEKLKEYDPHQEVVTELKVLRAFDTEAPWQIDAIYLRGNEVVIEVFQ